MRVTSQTKEATRRRIVESARNLFIEKGLDATTTRDLAHDAEIAAGTLFNYFPNKEAIAMTLVAEALGEAEAEFAGRRVRGATLEEELFGHVIVGLHALRAFRGFVGPVIETALSPLSRSANRDSVETFRVEHLETVLELMRSRGVPRPSFVAVYLYWTLYMGVLSFWACDESANQEDTLVLLDQSMRLFAASLMEKETALETVDVTQPA